MKMEDCARYSTTVPLTQDHDGIHSVRTYTAGRIYLVVYSNDAEQGFATDVVASLNERYSSVPCRIQHHPPPTPTGNHMRQTEQLTSPGYHTGLDVGLATELHKKITAKELNEKLQSTTHTVCLSCIWW